MALALADPSATLKTPAKDDIAARVTAQLQRDYPPGALSWITGLSWAGPQQVPVTQIDRTHGDTDWQAAAADKAKLQAFRKRIAAGWRKPVVLVRSPGGARLFAVDGHSRILSCEALGQPVTAYVGTAKTAAGPWTSLHSRQLPADPAVDLSAQTAGYSVTPSPLGRPGGPGLWFKGWKLPDYVENVARGIMQGGMADKSMAIATAIAACKRWAAGGGKVTPEVRAAAAKAIAEWEALKAAAPGTPSHQHANDLPALDLAGTFTEQLHPRVPAGQGGGGRFGSKGGPLTAKARARNTPVTAPVHAPMTGTSLTQAQQLRYQASQDRHLARQVLVKVAGLQRVRASYIAGKTTATGAPVNPAKSAAAKKAAATRAAAPGAAAKASAAAKKGASSRKATVAKMTRQIRTLKGDARALLSAANHLDAQAAGL
jgi:hypothetical protein